MQKEITAEGLKIAYGSNIIIENMNLEIPKGKVTMLIGSNGCGKSTLLKSIGRILRPSEGAVYIQGMDIKKSASKELAKKMAVLPQSPAVPAGLLVKELVAYGRFPYQKPFGGMQGHDLEVIDWAMEVTAVKEFAERRVDALSGGQRQRAFIAMVLAQETEIMILDEPTTYLDMSHQLEVLQLLQNINRKRGTTVVIVLHELNNATKFADHLVGMHEGEIIFEGAPKEVVTKENLRRLYRIDATLQMDKTGRYPICTDYEMIS